MSRPAVLHVFGRSDTSDVAASLVMSTTATRVVYIRLAPDAGPLPEGPAIDAVSPRLVDPTSPVALARVARRHRVAVMHAHGLDAAPLVAAVAARCRRPWFLTLEESAIARPGLVELASTAVAILVSSDRVAEKMKVPGLSADSIRVSRAHEIGARAAELDEMYLAAAEGRPVPHPPAPPTELPSISVVVATFNRRDLLVRTIESLLAQTYPAELVEIVVVDDQSTDGTAEMVSALGVDRVRLHRLPTKGYAAGARNFGIAHSDGEIVAFTDDDCRPSLTWLAAMVAGFAGGIDLVQGRTVPDPEQRRDRWSRTISTPREYGLYETANLAVRRSALEVLGEQPFDPAVPGELRRVLGKSLGSPGIGEDVDLGWRVRRRGGTRFAADAVVRHHVFDGSPWVALRDAVRAAGFPLLVRRVPELRRAFLWHRVFLRPVHAAIFVAVVGIALALSVTPYAAFAVAPYLWLILRPELPGRRGRLRRAPFGALRDLVELSGCLVGSIYARRLVI